MNLILIKNFRKEFRVNILTTHNKMHCFNIFNQVEQINFYCVICCALYELIASIGNTIVYKPVVI